MRFSKRTIILISCILFAAFTAVSVFGAEMEYAVYGTYPQSRVEETEELKAASYDKNGDAVVDGKKYRRVSAEDGFNYFVYEPVVWWKNGNTLIAINVLDCKMYDEQEEKIKDFMGGIKYASSVTWEECSIRTWLNGEFADLAFTDSEKARLSEEIRLVSRKEAEAAGKEMLRKTSTEYAVCMGAVTRINGSSSGDTEWLLKDISPIVSSTVCTVKNDGSINTGMTVLVNEKGMGVVPCITLGDFSGVLVYTGKAPEKKVELYYPGGETAEFTEEQVADAVAGGWYTDIADARKKNGLDMKARFEASALNSAYKWSLRSPQGKSSYISIDAPKTDMTPAEAIDLAKPIMDTFYTGNMKDYMEVHISFTFSGQTAEDLSDFSDNVADGIFDAAEACWSGWGNIICFDNAAGRGVGTGGADYTMSLRLKINGDGSYSVAKTNYNKTLHRLALEAKAYSDRPVGQLQYLRHYFGQNTVYDGRQFNNEPSTLINSGVGICGTYANFAADFCKLLGIPCTVYTNDSAMHAWNGVYVEGKWYHIDHTGVSDKKSMERYYSNYSVNGETFVFDPNGFPEEHTAENVSFLLDGYLPIDNLSEADVKYVERIFASDDYVITAIPSVSQPTEENREISVFLNGKKLIFDVLPINENGRVLVPMRKIFEELGATVYWNGESLTATGVRNNTVVTITVDSEIMTKNGENIKLDVPARLINSRTLVPVRVIAESFGLDVSWDGVTNSVKIKQ